MQLLTSRPSYASAPVASALVAPTLVALFAAVAMPAYAGNLDAEGRIFTRWDFPDGLPFLGTGSKMESRLSERWAEALARGGFEPVGEPKTNSKGERYVLMLSAALPVPVSALPPGMEKQVWYEYWIRTITTPEGATPEKFTSSGSRYLIRCEPLTVMGLGSAYFANGDSTGQPNKVYAFYRSPMDLSGAAMNLPGHKQAAERSCSQEMAEATEKRTADNVRDLLERMEDMQKIMAVRMRKALPPGGASSAPASSDSNGSTSSTGSTDSPGETPSGLFALMQDPTLFDEQGQPRPARIRLYGANGGGAYLHKGVACYSDDTEIQVAGGLASSFKSLVGATSNLSIGMPATELSRSVEAGGWNMGAKWFYQEHAIPAGEPTTVRIGTPACQMTSGSFIAVPGVDYEAKNVRAAEKGLCMMTVNRILPNGDLKPVPITAASRCVPGAAAAKPALDVPRDGPKDGPKELPKQGPSAAAAVN
ncbi:hypothetical protein SAMN05216359_104186 [Roseateles sp. YR242]|uniref:hypothetical protein n=1 Tax=Roseateles sp. YR242 TaxID=1855305 RepID=UPI0008D429A2|nr:hypothetical protein [Roseateles sp. YR242]SEK97451.1 hypothetical protein SAMN05216359_104186 [Roseateles sp. YR242]